MNRIILLDIDGVLVQPGGYRAALRATIQWFIGHRNIEENLLAELEKRGVSSEWDMAPLIIAAYWSEFLSRRSVQGLSEDVAIAAGQLLNQPHESLLSGIFIPEFELVSGQYPAESALEAGCFENIPEGLRKNLLTETRNINRSRTMRIFQQFTLGSSHFTETYNLPADFETESYLLKYDKPNVSAGILGRVVRPDHHLAAFTARPSKPPRELAVSNTDYAPEAELALELVGLQKVPLIAFGRLEYLAKQKGLKPPALVKPSPVHALAALSAAWVKDEWTSLKAVAHWVETGKLDGPFRELPKSFELIVVEDTLGGIRSAQGAAETLKQAGFDVALHPLGITCGDSSKAEAFSEAGVTHYENWADLVNKQF